MYLLLRWDGTKTEGKPIGEMKERVENNILFTHKQMHILLNLEKFKFA